MTVRTKICGLSTPPAVAAAVEGGAAFLGFAFYPPSPRNVSPATARSLTRDLPRRVHKVALLVDHDDTAIEDILEAVEFDLLQLHGDESPARVAAVRERFGRPVMKALRVAAPHDLARAAAYADAADWLLFDAKPSARAQGALPGGNAQPFDWSILADFPHPRPWMLSGGLDAANLAQAVRVTGATHVDVSSGVESTRGVKDVARIRAFLERAAAL